MKSEQPTTQHSRLLFIALISIALASLILYNLNSRLAAYISTYVDNLTEERAFLLSEPLERVITPKTYGFDLKNLDRYDKATPRNTLKDLVSADSLILHIHILSPEHQIVLSSNINLEGESPYASEELQQRLIEHRPLILQQRQDAQWDFLDVSWPVFIQNDFKGFIITEVRLARNQSLDSVRQLVLWIIGIMLSIIIMMVLWFSWKSEHVSGVAAEPETPATPEAGENPEVPATPAEPESVFSKLNEMYEGAEDIDKSFKQSAEKAHTMMRVLNQGLLILDLNMHIITHNEYILDVFQLRTRSAVQQKTHRLLQQNPRLLEMFRRAKDPLTKEVKDYFNLNLLNSRKIKVEVLARPFYFKDEITGVTFYIKNLDMLQELEDTLQRSMNYGAISQLSSSIGHEIRNPLSSLAIHTEIVDSMVSKSVNDEKRLTKIKKSINILNTEVERLNKLIDQFFRLAKPQQMALTYVNINDLMFEIYDLVYQQALEKNIEVKRRFTRDLPMVNVSRDKLKQVIINLILNGYDAMTAGGELTMRTHYHEGKVVISIKDTGAGIPANIRDNIFDLYFTTKDSGSGIGLAICRKIIEAHEGQLYFETKLGQGTIFYIELPTSQN